MERLNIKYIDEINAFHSWLQINELPASAIVLWYSLMHFCNKTGWKKRFNIPISKLQADTNLKKATLYRARNALEDSGLIKVIHRKGRQSALYILHPVTSLVVSQYETQSETQNPVVSQYETQSETQNPVVSQYETQSETIPRHRLLDKTKDASAAADSKKDVFDYYQNKIHPLQSSVECDMLTSLIDEHGPELCMKAIDRAVFRKKRTVKYIAGILRNWKLDGYDEPDGSNPQERDVPDEVKNIPF
nr:MAG TPA: Replication initiation and membrane attachment [Caudoviricetes sp.]